MTCFALSVVVAALSSACAGSMEAALSRAMSNHDGVMQTSRCERWQYYKITSVPDETWLEIRLTPAQIEHLVESEQLWLAACVPAGTPFDENMLTYGVVDMLVLSCVAGPESCGVIARAPATDICIMNYKSARSRLSWREPTRARAP